jgi:riboflavin synthase
MFTGLIQSLGTLKGSKRIGDAAELTISETSFGDPLEVGESIAVDGVCLTVTALLPDGFVADVSPETLACTTLGELRAGGRVNLERALRLADRLGGHLVSGHIDCIASVRQRYQDDNAIRFEFAATAAAMRYIVEKGSVAVNGISLTVNRVESDRFTVAVIPHSLANTTLKDCQVGNRVNIETDMIGRYVERLLPGGNRRDGGGMSREFLARNGFL